MASYSLRSIDEGSTAAVVKTGAVIGAVKLAGKLAKVAKDKVGNSRVAVHTSSHDSKDFINNLMNR